MFPWMSLQSNFGSRAPSPIECNSRPQPTTESLLRPSLFDLNEFTEYVHGRLFPTGCAHGRCDDVARVSWRKARMAATGLRFLVGSARESLSEEVDKDRIGDLSAK